GGGCRSALQRAAHQAAASAGAVAVGRRPGAWAWGVGQASACRATRIVLPHAGEDAHPAPTRRSHGMYWSFSLSLRYLSTSLLWWQSVAGMLGGAPVSTPAQQVHRAREQAVRRPHGGAAS